MACPTDLIAVADLAHLVNQLLQASDSGPQAPAAPSSQVFGSLRKHVLRLKQLLLKRYAQETFVVLFQERILEYECHILSAHLGHLLLLQCATAAVWLGPLHPHNLWYVPHAVLGLVILLTL